MSNRMRRPYSSPGSPSKNASAIRDCPSNVGRRPMLTAAGFEMVAWWTDRRGDYALSLSVR